MVNDGRRSFDNAVTIGATDTRARHRHKRWAAERAACQRLGLDRDAESILRPVYGRVCFLKVHIRRDGPRLEYAANFAKRGKEGCDFKVAIGPVGLEWRFCGGKDD